MRVGFESYASGVNLLMTGLLAQLKTNLASFGRLM